VTDLPVLQPTKFEDLVQEGHMPVTIRRRELIAAIGGATVASPLAARAQQPGRTFRLGVLIPSARETPPLVAFFDELRLNGFIEGQNIAVIPGRSDIRYEQVAEQMAAIIKAAPDAIVSGGLFATRAVQAATRTLPHVALSEDMVGDGFVISLAHPSGNTTGISIVSPELDGKRQESSKSHARYRKA
jgi:putative ABC transport system substrate-binding protein